MTVRGPLTEVIALCRHLLFDFDGPICGIFAGLPAPAVAAQLREAVTGRGVEIPADVQTADDPFDVLKYAATVDRDLAEQVEAELRGLETRGAESASATPYARQAIEAAHEAGYGIAAVSNNSRQAVAHYLTTSGLAPFFSVIVGRSDAGPSLLKPYSDLITQAVRELGAGPYQCALIGNSVSDIGDAQKAQVYSIGYATTTDEEDYFAYAGSDAVITSMADLIPAMAPVRDR
jgi:beta-phosphoglucomutase-like phosphatase (HAD superfamily)